MNFSGYLFLLQWTLWLSKSLCISSKWVESISIKFIIFPFNPYHICSIIVTLSVSFWMSSYLCMTWFLLNLLWCALWPRLWSVSINVLCASENNTQSAAVGGKVLSNVNQIKLILFKSTVSLLILFLSVTERMGIEIYACNFFTSPCNLQGFASFILKHLLFTFRIVMPSD